MGRSGSRLMLLILVIGIIGLLILGYLVWDRVLRPGGPDGALRPIELWDAYGSAHDAARAEMGDAQLVSASADWQAGSEEALLAGTSNWAFVFYSPSERSVLDVGANAQSAQVALMTRIWVAPSALVEGRWTEGPRDPLLVFLGFGGRDFMERNSSATIDLHLAAGENGVPEWTVVALDMGSQELLSVLIDGETMEVLTVSP